MTSSTTVTCSRCTNRRARNGTTWCCSTRVLHFRTAAQDGSTPASRVPRSGLVWWCSVILRCELRDALAVPGGRYDGIELALLRFERGIGEAAAIAFLEFLARQFDGRHSLADVDRRHRLIPGLQSLNNS